MPTGLTLPKQMEAHSKYLSKCYSKKDQNLKNRNHGKRIKRRIITFSKKNINRFYFHPMCNHIFPLNFNNEAIKRFWLNKNVENQVRSTFNEELLKRVIEAKLKRDERLQNH